MLHERGVNGCQKFMVLRVGFSKISQTAMGLAAKIYTRCPYSVVCDEHHQWKSLRIFAYCNVYPATTFTQTYYR